MFILCGSKQEVQKKINLFSLQYTFPINKIPSFDFICLYSSLQRKFIKFNIYYAT